MALYEIVVTDSVLFSSEDMVRTWYIVVNEALPVW